MVGLVLHPWESSQEHWQMLWSLENPLEGESWPYQGVSEKEGMPDIPHFFATSFFHGEHDNSTPVGFGGKLSPRSNQKKRNYFFNMLIITSYKTV